jgi:hypothetical protein
MKFRLTLGVVLATATMLGCGSPGAPRPPSLQLPKLVQDLRATRKGDNVYLAWSLPQQTTDQLTLRRMGNTRVCRSLRLAMTECEQPVREVATSQLTVTPPTKQPSKHGDGNQQNETKAPPPQVTAIDELPRDLQAEHSTESVSYAVESLNTRGRSAGLSNQVQVSLVPTLPAPEGLQADLTADGIRLSWTPVPSETGIREISHKYRVYRKTQGSPTNVVVGEVPQSGSAAPELQDKTFEWEKTYSYRVAVVTVLSCEGKPPVEVEGDDSTPATILARDAFPPATPNGLQAVFSGVGQKPFIDLTWAPNTEADLAGYNVYRREDNGMWVRLNSELVKTPTFRDGNVASGRKYFYTITAIDLRGNESQRSEEASEAVPKQ